MQDHFSRDPPVYAKPKNPVPPSVAQPGSVEPQMNRPPPPRPPPPPPPPPSTLPQPSPIQQEVPRTSTPGVASGTGSPPPRPPKVFPAQVPTASPSTVCQHHAVSALFLTLHVGISHTTSPASRFPFPEPTPRLSATIYAKSARSSTPGSTRLSTVAQSQQLACESCCSVEQLLDDIPSSSLSAKRQQSMVYAASSWCTSPSSPVSASATTTTTTFRVPVSLKPASTSPTSSTRTYTYYQYPRSPGASRASTQLFRRGRGYSTGQRSTSISQCATQANEPRASPPTSRPTRQDNI